MNPNVLKCDYEKSGLSERRTSQYEVNEGLLWQQFKSGSESAFIKIYETFFDVLLNYGFQLTGERGLAQDAIQDLFIILRQNRKNLGATDSIKFYLMKSLKRRLIKQMKKNDRFFSIDQNENFFEITFSHEKALIDKQLEEEQSQRLNQALKLLSGRKKEALYYFYFEGMDYEQIRDLMGFSNIKSVRNLVYKAIGILRSSIK